MAAGTFKINHGNMNHAFSYTVPPRPPGASGTANDAEGANPCPGTLRSAVRKAGVLGRVWKSQLCLSEDLLVLDWLGRSQRSWRQQAVHRGSRSSVQARERVATSADFGKSWYKSAFS